MRHPPLSPIGRRNGAIKKPWGNDNGAIGSIARWPEQRGAQKGPGVDAKGREGRATGPRTLALADLAAGCGDGVDLFLRRRVSSARHPVSPGSLCSHHLRSGLPALSCGRALRRRGHVGLDRRDAGGLGQLFLGLRFAHRLLRPDHAFSRDLGIRRPRQGLGR